ncbi:MAG: hypothetical protein E6Q76_00260 [Rhizobium sp.]|nr:MAG: hypothetical protein E6Q76_00260 [Rhizobium sp.]
MAKFILPASLMLLAACSGGSRSESVSDIPLSIATPDTDDFYSAPARIPDTPGTILKSRAITYQPAGVPLPNPAWQLQYVTHDSQGKPIAAVTTVIQPLVPSLYGHPVLLSFQHAYDSLGAICTPSHTATGSTSNSTNLGETLEFAPGLETLGWTLVIPDYEGPKHAWGAARVSGQATLDSIRAALAFEPLGLSQNTPVALWGYSGGAYATTWAVALQPGYAPELQLVGAVAGGTPVSLLDVIPPQDGTVELNFLFMAVMGVAREYPEILPRSLLTEKGAHAVDVLKDACSPNTASDLPLPAARMSDYVAASDPYTTPGFQSVGPKLSLMQNSLHPTTDVYMFHEISDGLLPIASADALVAKWCAEGVPLSYYRSHAADVVALADPIEAHTVGAVAGTPTAIAYLTGRFAGLPNPVTPLGSVRCN